MHTENAHMHPYTHAVLNFNVLNIFPRVAWAKVNVYTSKSDARVDFRPRGTAKSKNNVSLGKSSFAHFGRFVWVLLIFLTWYEGL